MDGFDAPAAEAIRARRSASRVPFTRDRAQESALGRIRLLSMPTDRCWSPHSGVTG